MTSSRSAGVRGSFTGRLVDSAEARSALADLYDVPLCRIRRAGRRAHWSDSGLGVTYKLLTPWFEALGIDIAEPVDEGMVLVRGRPVWREAFERVEDAEGYMRDAVATIRNDVLPMLETYGSLDGYRRFCAEQAGDPDKPRSLYPLAATEIILERYDDANAALDEVRARVQYQPDPWSPGPATPETRALLLARAAGQRRLLSLPGSY